MVQMSNKLVLLVIVHLWLGQSECITVYVVVTGGLKHNIINLLISNLSLVWLEKLMPYLSAYVTDYGTVPKKSCVQKSTGCFLSSTWL